MKKLHISLIYILVGITIAIFGYFSESQVLNIKDTYYVCTPTSFSIFILAFYLLVAAVYYCIKKYSNYAFGLTNLIFLTIPILYFIYSNSQSYDNDFPGYITNETESLWKNEYIPVMFLIIFLKGVAMLLIKIISSILDRMNLKIRPTANSG